MTHSAAGPLSVAAHALNVRAARASAEFVQVALQAVDLTLEFSGPVLADPAGLLDPEVTNLSNQTQFGLDLVGLRREVSRRK